MSHINGIVRIDKQGNTVFHLLLISIKELIKSLHLSDITGRDSNHLTLIHTIGENKFQRSAHIEKCSIMPSFCFTCFLRFYTANDIVVPGIFQR